jgi:hypothetical protein
MESYTRSEPSAELCWRLWFAPLASAFAQGARETLDTVPNGSRSRIIAKDGANLLTLGRDTALGTHIIRQSTNSVAISRTGATLPDSLNTVALEATNPAACFRP